MHVLISYLIIYLGILSVGVKSHEAPIPAGTRAGQQVKGACPMCMRIRSLSSNAGERRFGDQARKPPRSGHHPSSHDYGAGTAAV
jgi:hypothetical protein